MIYVWQSQLTVWKRQCIVMSHSFLQLKRGFREETFQTLYICMRLCMYMCVYVYVYVCMYVCVCACVCMYMCVCVCVYACVCMYVCVCVCMCVYVYMYMCIYVCVLCMYVTENNDLTLVYVKLKQSFPLRFHTSNKRRQFCFSSRTNKHCPHTLIKSQYSITSHKTCVVYAMYFASFSSCY